MHLLKFKTVVFGVLLAVILLGAGSGSAKAATIKYVKSTTLKIRKGASSSAKSIGQYKKGDKVTVYSQKGNWAKVKKNKKFYYVFSKYLSSKKISAKKKASATASVGKTVVNYAKKFVGKPYRYGGTSLTKGTDCSGFTKSVYKHFGFSLPRSSSAQRHAGKKVKWSEKQPGDIICYSGHVAIYMGNNKIVHASNPKTGIKISNKADYRSVICVRRILE